MEIVLNTFGTALSCENDGLVVKYLEKKGCHRIQKSIFMADTPAEVWFCIARRSLVHIIVKIVIHDN